MPGRNLATGDGSPEKRRDGKELDDFSPGDVSGATGVATTGTVASGFEERTAGNAGTDLDFNGGKIRQTSRVILQLDVLDHRRRKTLDFVGLKFPLDFLRHQQVPLYT